jgi:hypothetical protein
MPADLGLVANATHADAGEPAPERAGDAAPQRCLATPGGPENRMTVPAASPFSRATASSSRMRFFTRSMP